MCKLEFRLYCTYTPHEPVQIYVYHILICQIILQVWYDSEYRFVRFDYRLRNQVSPLYTLNPITEVHDYNYGNNTILLKYGIIDSVEYSGSLI